MNALSNPAVDQTLTGVFRLIVPEAILVGFACILLLMATLRLHRFTLLITAMAGVVAAALAALAIPVPTTLISTVTPFLGDDFAQFIRLTAFGFALLFCLLGFRESGERYSGEYLACLLIATAGIALAGAANDLLTIFLALEMVSIPTYILLYIPKRDTQAQEAAVKYFLLSVLSSGLLLFGFSYLYGATGTLNLAAIIQTLPRLVGSEATTLSLVAIVMILAGLGFRITAVPFHFYAPDVYQGGPTGVVAFLAVVPKLAGFAVLIRILGLVVVQPGSPLPFANQIPLLLWILAVITMCFGNILALLQEDIRRLLAYSSVAHGGYMLIGIATAANQAMHDTPGVWVNGVEAVLFYLVAYGAMTVGAFSILAMVNTPERPVETIDDLAGLNESHPRLAMAMGLFLFSLIGLPLTAGFAGKFLLFAGALSMPLDGPQGELYRILVVIAAINAAVAAYYYLRVIGVMFLRSAFRPLINLRSPSVGITIVLCVLLTLAFGVYPWPLLQFARMATTGPTELLATDGGATMVGMLPE